MLKNWRLIHRVFARKHKSLVENLFLSIDGVLRNLYIDIKLIILHKHLYANLKNWPFLCFQLPSITVSSQLEEKEMEPMTTIKTG